MSDKDQTIQEVKEEDARLNQVIINLHDELRKITEQNRKLKNIVIWQQEIIQNYNELMQIVSSD